MWDLIVKLVGGSLGGGLLGILGQFAVGWMETKRLDAESRRRISEMEAMRNMKIAEGELRAFDSAQNAAGNASAGAPGWCAAVITLTRPVLTFLLLCFAVYVYATAAPEVRAGMTDETTACAFGAVWFWFGSRYQARLRK
jgi:hypothetical protein